MIDRSCLWCSRYVGCRTRINRMRKIKKNHGSANRADIRLRIAVMDHPLEKHVIGVAVQE